jgi:hypothetical protein
MIRAMVCFAWMLPTRLRAIWQLVADPVLSRSYYPEEQRKSKARIMLENLWWLLRWQEVNYEYLYYGMDRRHGVDFGRYLSKYEFKKLRDQANAAANAAATAGDTRHRRLNYRLLLGDKFVFCRFLKGLGFPTPEILALGDKDGLFWLDTRKRMPVGSLLDRRVDVFLKEDLFDGGTRDFHLTVEGGRLLAGGRGATVEEVLSRTTGHYILQQRIEQHPEMARLHPRSVNTVRLVTTLAGGQAGPLCAIVRIGSKGSQVDNWSVGGMAVAVDLETGRLGKYALFKPGYGTKVDRHPETGAVFDGFEVPFFREAVRLATELHKFFYGFHSIGWDIAITAAGPVFLEGNDDWGLAAVQGPCGGLRERFLASLGGK